MKFVIVLLAVLAISAMVADAKRSLPEEVYQDLFKHYTRAHNKAYHPSEISRRYSIFQDNYELILAHNARNESYTLGLNQFADMTVEEFSRTVLGARRTVQRVRNEKSLKVKAPESYDWRQHGAVTEVKDQGQCGSCYTFSAVGAIEGAWAINKGELINLSEKQAVDCSQSFGNQGCQGGLMDNVFDYVKANGIESWTTYPYEPSQGTCEFNAEKVVARVTGHVDVPRDEDELKNAAAQNPVSVAINAASSQFQLYSGGVFKWSDCPNTESDLDHGVLVVGYGLEGSEAFWIVKNSWSATWGEDGFIRMARGVNQCGIKLDASYPTV